MSDIFHILKTYRFPDYQVIMEIGAADLLDTPNIIQATGFKDGEYYAFEPEPRNLASSKNGVCPGISIIQAAVGDSNRRASFNRCSGFNVNLMREHTYSGSLKNPVQHLEFHKWCRFDETITVPMIRLDSFRDMLSIETVHFAWCDVQGAEDLVVKGAQETLRRTHLFYTEFYNFEMYEGQWTDEAILNALPGEWAAVRKWENDILFENLSLPRLNKRVIQDEDCTVIPANPEKV